MSTPDESSISLYLAKLIDQIRSARLSPEDRRILRQHLLDAIGSAFIGYQNPAFQSFIRLCPRVKVGCSWPGSGKERLNSLDGAMVWAFLINSSVFEDGSREGACHPGAVIIPTIIALSEGKDWERIDRAMVAGYEVMVRLARSGNPEFTLRGFHPTAIMAPFGAAATASFLLDYDPVKSQNALCLAALAGAGLMASFRSGETQPLQVAWSVRSGMAAARMAGMGSRGYPRIFEEGFYPAYLGSQPSIPVDQPLEFEFAFRGCYLKPYPGCRHIHPCIDALVEILKEKEVDPSQIQKIQVHTYKIAVETEIHDVNRRGDAYFNIRYAIAARMVLGKCDWDAFDERHLKNESLLEIMEKVKVSIDAEIESQYPRQRGAKVEISLKNGAVLHGKVKHALGEPETPFSYGTTLEKFKNNAGKLLSKRSRDRVASLLDVAGLTESAKSLFDTLGKSLPPPPMGRRR
jgi:2-methylcitrate dehydratase PrpD